MVCLRCAARAARGIEGRHGLDERDLRLGEARRDAIARDVLGDVDGVAGLDFKERSSPRDEGSNPHVIPKY